MILYIAEKPSLGRAIAAVLPRPHKKGDGFITLANGDVVSWCIGHILEQAQPEAYDPDYKKWTVEHLPIIPDQWKLVVKSKTRKQFTRMNKLIVRVKRNIGWYPISFWVPLFLSIPVGSIIVAKFYGKRIFTFPLIVIGIVLNGLIITTIRYFAIG